MQKFIVQTLILLSGFLLASLSNAQKITLSCPSITQIIIEKQAYDESWRAYKDTANIPVHLPALQNQLSMLGQGESTIALNFKTIDWLYGCLACFYQGNRDTIVLINNDLANYVTKCYFLQTNIRFCNDSDPTQCVMTCNLKKLKSLAGN